MHIQSLLIPASLRTPLVPHLTFRRTLAGPVSLATPGPHFPRSPIEHSLTTELFIKSTARMSVNCGAPVEMGA